MKLRSLKLPPSLDAKVSAIAERRRISRSEVLREAVSVYRPDAVASFAELAADLCGCARGPRDLASGRRHLAGYGR